MGNQIPLDSPEFDEQSNHLAAATPSLHQDGVDYAFRVSKAHDPLQPGPELSGCTPAGLGSFDRGLVLPCNLLPWAQGLVHHAGNNVAATGVDFPQSSRNGNVTTTGPRFQPSVDAAESSGSAEDSFLPSDPAAVEPTHAEYASSLPPSELIQQEKAVVMELPDGTFYCSALGCWEIYRRSGDCRRHLKKHNGPFTLCPVPNCGMQFHRDDKLRDHLRQRHLIVLTAPPRGQHLADLVTYLPAGFLYLGGYYEAEA